MNLIPYKKPFISNFFRSLFIILSLGIVLGATYSWINKQPKTEQISLEPATIIPDQILDQSKRNNTLSGKIVTLRTLREDYIEAYHDMFSADVRKGLSFTAAVDDEDYTIGYITWTLSRQAKGELMSYAIFDNVDNVLVGAIEIRSHHSTDPGQLGCWINDNYRGGGRIQEAIKLITNEYFRMTNAPVVSAFVEPFNKRSYKAMNKAGFVEKYNKDKHKHKKEYHTLELTNPNFTK